MGSGKRDTQSEGVVRFVAMLRGLPSNVRADSDKTTARFRSGGVKASWTVFTLTPRFRHTDPGACWGEVTHYPWGLGSPINSHGCACLYVHWYCSKSKYPGILIFSVFCFVKNILVVGGIWTRVVSTSEDLGETIYSSTPCMKRGICLRRTSLGWTLWERRLQISISCIQM